MEERKLFEAIARRYSERMLGWALRKTGSRPDAEDLAHEVLLQAFIAASRYERIDNLEHFVWKVAHFVWCNRVRALSRSRLQSPDSSLWDGEDFAADLAQRDWLDSALARMRRRIADLSALQRESIVLHYLDGLSVAEVAKRLNATESAIAWHLFDARKRMKKELDRMKDDNSYVYRPGKLSLGGSGLIGSGPDTDRVNDSLIRQNLCLLCYREAKTLDQIAALTGIPKPYLEYDLDWLVRRELLALQGKRYSTIFPIIGRKHYQDLGQLYTDTRAELIDVVLDRLWENEAAIRKIGFHGAQFPTEKLMWPMIMMFTSYVSRNSPLMLRLKKRDEREIRPDGGRYYIMASDLSDDQPIDPNGYSKPAGWGGFYGICSDSCATGGMYDSYYWLGVYNFVQEQYHPRIIDGGNRLLQKLLHKAYCAAAEPGFSPDSLDVDEREVIAEAVESRLIERCGDAYTPNFVVMADGQLRELQRRVFAPLLEEIAPCMELLAEKIARMLRADMPAINRGYVDYHTYVGLWDFGIYTLMFAAQAGKLWLPPTPEQGVPLTLVLVK